LNISNPATGAQKLVDIEDERKLRPFMDKRISAEVDASCLGNEWKVSLSSCIVNVTVASVLHIHAL
jgi:ribosomal protein S6E (S10)